MEMELTPEKVKKALKQVMKTRKLTFKDLADTLDCSLPTAKRVLNQEELSLSRLARIMDWLDISFKELEKLMETVDNDNIPFNDKQDAFLAANPKYFSYLIQLRSGETPESIAKKFALTKPSTDKYLIKLEQLELIRVTGTGKVKIPVPTPTAFAPQGKLARCYFNRIIDNGATYFKTYIEREIYKNPNQPDEFKDEGAGFSVKAMHISKETYNIYQKKLMSVFMEMTDSAKTDEKIHGKENLNSSVVILATSIGQNSDPEFKEILNTFGDVENL